MFRLKESVLKSRHTVFVCLEAFAVLVLACVIIRRVVQALVGVKH
jgi:hypothetical protein